MSQAGPGPGLPGVPLAATARWIAAVRAGEAGRPDRLLDDPWAAALAGPEGEKWFGARAGSPALVDIIIRARFFDDFLRRVTGTGGVRQVVLLAAGLDTRGYRLGWPGQVQLFELDQPEVLHRKQEILDGAGAKPRCARRAVGTDLTGRWATALLEAGFDPRAPSCWLAEGFLFYLPGEQIARLLDEVTGLAHAGSWLGFDIVNTATLTHPLTRPWIDMQARLGAPWLGTLDDPAGFLAGRGWEATLTQPGEPGASYGRWSFPVLAPGLPGAPRHWLVTARTVDPGSLGHTGPSSSGRRAFAPSACITEAEVLRSGVLNFLNVRDCPEAAPCERAGHWPAPAGPHDDHEDFGYAEDFWSLYGRKFTSGRKSS